MSFSSERHPCNTHSRQRSNHEGPPSLQSICGRNRSIKQHRSHVPRYPRNAQCCSGPGLFGHPHQVCDFAAIFAEMFHKLALQPADTWHLTPCMRPQQMLVSAGRRPRRAELLLWLPQLLSPAFSLFRTAGVETSAPSEMDVTTVNNDDPAYRQYS